MKENIQTIIREEVYSTPLCTTTDILSEGVLCGSIQQIEEYEKEFEW